MADGVASSSDGAFAAQFILNELKAVQFKKDWNENVAALLNVNQTLLKLNAENGTNSASTLCGIYNTGNEFQVFQAGDCEVYIIRNDRFIPLAPMHNESVDNIKKKYPGISTEQAYEKAANTITSFYGSQLPQLRFDQDWKRRLSLPAINGIQTNDKIVICSDGLFKSISKKELKEILKNIEDRNKAMTNVIELSKNNGAVDNLSLIVIEDFAY